MFFTVVTSWSEVPPNSQDAAFLVVDGWDDWFSFRTMFTLWIFDEQGARHRVGSVKIGERGLKGASSSHTPLPPGVRSPQLPETFDALDERFFSLGQDENYYETLNGLSSALHDQVLLGLRDCAYDLAILDSAKDEEVLGTSLLRSVNATNVRTRLHRLSNGDATLTEFKFEYEFAKLFDNVAPPILRFDVTPDSQPPTNVHVLIGRNGVGKTRCMRGLAKALLGREATLLEEPVGTIRTDTIEGQDWSFSGLAMICFSAFDDFDLRPKAADHIRSNQVGLIQWDDHDISFMKTPDDLAQDFVDSFSSCRQGPRLARWQEAVETLETDDLFAEANVTSLIGMNDDTWEQDAIKLYKRLSSGHAIVLLTITRLVELVDERTLVLLDEPEGHLHPPLLSAFIRALSALLIKRNGVAIISTHSPVVLQEVPRRCAWKLRRSGYISVAERPAVETFGENVGLLTREVFGFEVTKSGFHRLLDEAVNERDLNYEETLQYFSDQLGDEARAIVQALVAQRDATD